MLEDRAGGDIATLARAADALTAAARKRPELGTVISTFRPSVPGYSIDMDTDKLQTMGISLTDAYNTLQTFLGGLYVNDFNQFGHTWQVLLQAEPEFRDQPSSVGRFYVRNSSGDMVPLSTLATITPSGGPDVVYRYNRFRAIQLLGTPAPGYSSGQASAAMEEVAAASLPQGFGYEWTGTTYQEKQAQGNEGAIFGFAAVLVFLFLAALYESWSIPFAVLFALPLGMFGALAGVYLRSYPYDIYTQIGIVTLIGLAAKNAILIVEFAKESHEQGKSVRDAAIEAAHLRLRPILMTSFAFILGVLPLVLASGASSGARRSLGTAVFSGMLTATLLAIFIVPVLYVMIESFVERRRPAGAPAPLAGGRPMKRTILALSVLALAGCTMGPNYKRPQVAVPGAVPRRAHRRRGPRRLDCRHQVAGPVSRPDAQPDGHHRAGAQLRPAHRRGACGGSARATRHYARQSVSLRECPGGLHRGAEFQPGGRFPGARRHQPERFLHLAGRGAFVGTGHLGPPAPPDRSRARPLSGQRRRPPRGGRVAGLRRDGELFPTAGAGPRTGDQPQDAGASPRTA